MKFYKSTITGNWVLDSIVAAIPGTYELIVDANERITIKSNRYNAVIVRDLLYSDFTDESDTAYISLDDFIESSRLFFVEAAAEATIPENLTTAVVPDSTNRRYVTDAQRTVIQNTSNTNTGDETNSTIVQKLGELHVSSGMLTEPIITDNGSGNISISSSIARLADNSDGSGIFADYTIPAMPNVQLSPNSYVYITVNYNAGSPIYQLITDNVPINHFDVLNAAQVYWEQYGGITTLHVFTTGSYGYGQSNKIAHRLIHTERFGYQDGFDLVEIPNRGIAIGDGSLWYDGLELLLDGINTDIAATYQYSHASGSYVISEVTSYNNSQYDDGTNLVTLSDGRYAVNFIYRSVSADLIQIVLGNGDYTLLDAQNATAPAFELPTILSKQSKLIGRVVVLKGATEASQIDMLLEGSISTIKSINHNDTAGKQGGNETEAYHLTAAQHTVVSNTSGVNTGDQTTISGNAGSATKLQTARKINGVDFDGATDITVYDATKEPLIGYTTEDVANKENTTLDNSTTKYPTNNLVKTYVDNRVAGLLDYRGSYDASVNTYPTVGSGDAGIVTKGDTWAISVAGVLGSVPIQIGDYLIAKIDNPGQTTSNWDTLNTNISYAPEDVANKENTTLDTSETKYPTNKLVKSYTDTKFKYYHGIVQSTVNIAIFPTHITTTTFTLSGAAYPFSYYFQGSKVDISTNISVTIGSTKNLYFIYFNGATGQLAYSAVFPGISYTSNVFVATIQWNGNNYGLINYEMHGHTRNHEWHINAHNTIGARYGGGLEMSVTTGIGTGTFALTAGRIYDEDIIFNIPTSSAFITPNTLRTWYQTSATEYAFDTLLSAIPYKAGTANRPTYVNASTYTLTTMTSATNRYINVFIYATTDAHTPIYSIVETVSSTVAANNGYSTASEARTISFPKLTDIALSAEYKPLYRLVIRADGQIQPILPVDDYRTMSSLPLSGGNASIAAASVLYAATPSVLSTNAQAAITEVANKPSISCNIVSTLGDAAQSLVLTTTPKTLVLSQVYAHQLSALNNQISISQTGIYSFSIELICSGNQARTVTYGIRLSTGTILCQMSRYSEGSGRPFIVILGSVKQLINSGEIIEVFMYADAVETYTIAAAPSISRLEVSFVRGI
jgi:hypothetical protein